MIIITKFDRRKWIRLIEEIVIESRKGSPRAQAWFKGDAFRQVAAELFDAEQIAGIEQQALADEKDKDDDDEEQAPAPGPNRSAEGIERQRTYNRERYHKLKEVKLAAKVVPTKIVWPSDLVTPKVSKRKSTPEELRSRRIERARLKHGYYERQASKPTPEAIEELKQQRAQAKRDKNTARYHRLKAERAQQKHIPANIIWPSQIGANHGTQVISS